MKIKLLTIIICLFFVSNSLAFSKEEIVFIHQQKTIDFPGIKRAAIGEPTIATAKVIQELNQILITGKSIGKTNLTVWDKNEQQDQIVITVMLDLSEVAKEIRERLYNVKGIFVRIVGSRINVSGTIKSQKDISKVKRIINDYPIVINDTNVSDMIIDTIARKINNEFKKFDITSLIAKRTDKTIIIEGEILDSVTEKKAKIIASSLFSNVEYAYRLIKISSRLITIKVDFIEIDKDLVDNLGVKWSGLGIKASANGIGGFGVNQNSFSGNYHAETSDYSVYFNAIITSGKSRIIKQPKVIVASGEEVVFKTGGEVPVSEITTTGGVIMKHYKYKDYGTALKVCPYINEKDKISSRIELKHSDIGNTKESAPKFNTNELKTSIKIKSGQTIVISGFSSLSNKKSTDQVFLLGSIPFLGKFFKSTATENGNKEVMILLTLVENNKDPEKVEKAQKSMMKKFNDQNKEFPIIN